MECAAVVCVLIVLLCTSLLVFFFNSSTGCGNVEKILVTSSMTRNSYFNFTCQTEKEACQCPAYMTVYKKLKNLDFKEDFQTDGNLMSVIEVGQAIFDEKSLAYNSRKFFGYYANGNMIDAFDFDKKIDYFNSKKITITVNDFDPGFKHVEFECQNDFPFLERNCSNSKADIQYLTNVLRSVLELKSVIYKDTVGMVNDTSSGSFIMKEYSIVGAYKDGQSKEHVIRNILEFDQHRMDWCKCMKPLKGDKRLEDICSKRVSSRRYRYDYDRFCNLDGDA